MTNVVHHANATLCTITIMCIKGQLRLQIQDNGQTSVQAWAYNLWLNAQPN